MAWIANLRPQNRRDLLDPSRRRKGGRVEHLTVLAEMRLSVSWYLLPLAAIISLVYSASRYELAERVVRRAVRLYLQIILFMVAVFGLLLLLSGGL